MTSEEWEKITLLELRILHLEKLILENKTLWERIKIFFTYVIKNQQDVYTNRTRKTHN